MIGQHPKRGEMMGLGANMMSQLPPPLRTFLHACNLSHTILTTQYSLTAHCALTGGCLEAQWDDGIASFGR